MGYEQFNGVRSTIIDQGTNPPAVSVSRDQTFIFGTARKGPLHTPVAVTTETIQSIFGTVPLDSSFDTSVVRGFYEYINSSAGTPDVSLIRVGSAAGPRIDLYENVSTLSGDLSYTLTDAGTPETSMWIQALEDGEEYNGTLVTVTEDTVTGYPIYMEIELPDETTVGYNLSPVPGTAGVVNKVSDLVALINEDENLSGKLLAGYTPLEKEVSLTVTRTLVSGTLDTYTIDRTYDLAAAEGSTNESWGDKIYGLISVYQERDVEHLVDAGATSAVLDYTPDKSLTEGTVSIDTFIRQAAAETVLTVSAQTDGQSNYDCDLYCSSVTGWDNTYSIISGDATLPETAWSFKLHVKRNGTTSLVELERDVKYSVNATTGVVTIIESLSAGDVYYATYRYKVSYSEAKLRSDLLSGSDRNYFIFGNTIVFGAAQPADVYLYFTSNVEFTSGDIKIDDYDNSVITFTNADNLPVYGTAVTVNVAYEPELPAATGKVLPGAVVQPGSLTGGSDGRIMTKQRYLEAIKDAMVAVDLYPRRRMVVMGMYLDDVVSGYNEETGMPEDIALNMHASILPYVERTSKLANECDICIPVRPLSDLSQSSVNTWITRLTVNSDTDLYRPANIIDGINSFRADAPLGVLIGAISEVNSGKRYYMNPACVYSAYKQNLSSSKSAINDYVPGNVRDLGVKIFNAETISALNAKRYTTAIVNYGGQFVWADAPTLAISGRSQFDRQFVRDTVYLAVSMAREAAEKYIGKPRTSAYLMSMKKDVGKVLGYLVPDILTDVYVEIVNVADGHISGKTKLRLILETAKEIRVIDIETTISLAAA